MRQFLRPNAKVEYERGAGFTDAADPAAIQRAADLELPGAQEQFLEAVYTANPKTALILMNAGPLAVTSANDHLPAILDAWYPGEAGGIAIARALFGTDNPGGHLPYTVYASLDGVPPQNEYEISKGFTYLYFKGVPLYAFGHGLSYTRFRYSNLKLSATSGSPADTIQISFDIKNSGDRAGSDVAQLYTHQQQSSTYQHIQSLRAFERVTFQPGESKHLGFVLPLTELAFYDIHVKAFRVEPSAFDLMIGTASDDIRLRSHFEVRSSNP